MNLLIILPAYNEGRVIGSVLEQLPKTLPGLTHIETLVIDDGSTDETRRISRRAGALVLRHHVNRGVGLATITGLAAARTLGADCVVTMDSDGQHDAADLAKVLRPIIDGNADIVIGSRLLTREPGMPWIRQLGNRLMNGLVKLFWGIKTTDSQSGFRAYSRYALNRLHLTTSGYEVCTEILAAAKIANLRLTEVPIKIIYTDYSKRKGQRITNAVNIVVRLVVRAISG